MNKTHRDKETETEPKKKKKRRKRLLHMKAQKAVIRNKYSPALSSKVGSCNVQFPCHLYSIDTTSSSSSSSSSDDDNDSGSSSSSCEVRAKEQEDTQQGSHFGPSDHTRFGIWSVRLDLIMDGRNQIRSPPILDGPDHTKGNKENSCSRKSTN